jgi:hypothetical protein
MYVLLKSNIYLEQTDHAQCSRYPLSNNAESIFFFENIPRNSRFVVSFVLNTGQLQVQVKFLRISLISTDWLVEKSGSSIESELERNNGWHIGKHFIVRRMDRGSN